MCYRTKCKCVDLVVRQGSPGGRRDIKIWTRGRQDKNPVGMNQRSWCHLLISKFYVCVYVHI